MPKTKNGGFILDDSGLNPYSIDRAKKKAGTKTTKKTASKKTGTKKKSTK